MTYRSLRQISAPAAVTVAALFMLALTWRTWPDAVYDFGSQLYYPWRMAGGQHLYTDIAYFNGPLSQWINTVAFKTFGVGLTTLIAVNLAVTAAVAAVLRRLTSVFGVLVFVLVFAFGQYVSIGNYNWVCPYTHEVTHGVALSLAAILTARRPTKVRTVLAGVLLGLVFLTKAEVFVPAVIAVGIGLFAARGPKEESATAQLIACDLFRRRAGFTAPSRVQRRGEPRPAVESPEPLSSPKSDGNAVNTNPQESHQAETSLMSIAAPTAADSSQINRGVGGWNYLAIAAILIPPLIAFAILTKQTGPAVAVRGVLGSWPWIFDRRVSSLAFYRRGLGVDDIPGNLLRTVIPGAIELLALGVVISAGLGPRRLRSTAVVLALLGSAAALFWWESLKDVARPWPVLIGTIVVFQLFPRTPGSSEYLKSRRSPESTGRLMLSIFALGLMGKMILNARIAQYGFALAMPAGVVLADAALVTLPRWIASRGGDKNRAITAAAFLIAAVVGVHVYVTSMFTGNETIRVGTGPDQYRADPRGSEINRALAQLTEIDPRGKTLAVFPQGLMLNYLVRRPDPVAVVNLMPPEVLSTGEKVVLEMLKKSPPDAIIVSAKDVADGGFLLTEGRYVYAKSVLAWVIQNYTRRTQIDPESQLKLTIWTRR